MGRGTYTDVFVQNVSDGCMFNRFGDSDHDEPGARVPAETEGLQSLEGGGDKGQELAGSKQVLLTKTFTGMAGEH